MGGISSADSEPARSAVGFLREKTAVGPSSAMLMTVACPFATRQQPGLSSFNGATAVLEDLHFARLFSGRNHDLRYASD